MYKILLFVLVLILSKNVFSNYSDTTVNCVGKCSIQSAYLKIAFKQKNFFETKFQHDTLEVWYVKDEKRKNKYLKFSVKSQQEATFYKIDTAICLINKGIYTNNSFAKNYPQNFYIYELISFDRVQKDLLSSEIPESLTWNCKEVKDKKVVSIQKRDRTNLDTITCLVKEDFIIDQNNSVSSYTSIVNMFNDSQVGELRVIESKYYNDGNNKEIEHFILESYKKIGPSLVMTSVKDESYDTKLEKTDIKVGEVFKNCQLFVLEHPNKARSLSSLINNYALIKLTYNSCAPCVMSIPAMETLNKKWKDKMTVINLNVINAREDIIAFNKKQKVEVDTYFNPQIKIELRDKVSIYPTFVIVDKALNVIFIQTGYSANLEETLETELKKLVQ